MKPITSPIKNGDIEIKGMFFRIPFIREMIYGFKWPRYFKSLKKQLSERGSIPDTEWINTERLKVARKMEGILKEECWGEELRFHPDDPYMVVGEFEVGDLSEIEAIMDIEEEFNIKIPEDEFSEKLKNDITFGDFVDYIIELSSNKTTPDDNVPLSSES